MAPAPAPSQVHAGQHRGAQTLLSSRVQHDPSVGPAPVRYVNFLACGGYTVEIIGGKHFKIPEGEFVELKSGTQYKIHVKNTHAYGKKSIRQCWIHLFLKNWIKTNVRDTCFIGTAKITCKIKECLKCACTALIDEKVLMEYKSNSIGVFCGTWPLMNVRCILNGVNNLKGMSA